MKNVLMHQQTPRLHPQHSLNLMFCIEWTGEAMQTAIPACMSGAHAGSVKDCNAACRRTGLSLNIDAGHRMQPSDRSEIVSTRPV